MIGITGYICLDLFPKILGEEPFTFQPGQLLETGPLTGRVGGVAGNTGGAIARMGVPAKIRAVVGEDMFGGAIRQAFQPLLHENQQLELVSRPGGTAATVVLNPPNQDRMFLVNKGVNANLKASDFGPEYRQGITILHFGYPPLCETMTVENGKETAALFRTCRAEGILTSLDMCVPSPGTFAYDMDWIAYFKEVLPETDLFCPSIDEIRFMLKMPSESPEKLTERLLELGASAVFLKMGSDGLMIHTADTEKAERTFAKIGSRPWRNIRHFVPPQKIKVYGTTGAGDSAIAGLLVAVDHGCSAAEAAEFGATVATTLIASPLGMDAITPELLKFLP